MATPKKPAPKRPAKRPPHAMRDAPPAHDAPRERLSVGTPGRVAAMGFWFLPYFDPGHVTAAKRAAWKVMLRDPFVKAALLGKVLAVAALDWNVIPVNEKNPAEKLNAEFLRHCIERLEGGLCGLAQTTLLPMLVDGYQASEKVRCVEGDGLYAGKIVYDAVKGKPTSVYDLEVDAYMNVTGIRGKGPNAGHSWPLSEFVFTRYLPVYDNPAGTSDLDAAYAAHWMEDTVTKLRAMHAEKYVSPSVTAEYADAADKPALEEALEKMRSRTWAAVPAGVKIQALNFANQGESDFKSFVDDCQKKKIIAITGAYLQMVESGPNDPRGSSQTAKSVSELFQWLLAVVFQETVSRQMFVELTRWNSPGVPPPRLVMGGVSEDEVTKIIGNFQGLQSLGYTVSAEDVARRTSYQQGVGADVLKRPAQPSPFPGAPGVAPAGAFRG